MSDSLKSADSIKAGLSVECLTPRGRGAVAVVRVRAHSDADAKTVEDHFRSASDRRLATVDINRICYGHWREEDVVAVRTAVREWEIYCHGGEAAVNRIIADLGADTSDPQIDTLTTLLLQCRTVKTANLLLAQQEGLLHKFTAEVCDIQDVQQAAETIESFLQWERFADHLTDPWRVVIAGLPNAGKSSLLNAVLGYERTIVFDQPGTTRDRVEAEVIIDGWPFRFLDTAGVRRNTQDEIESLGVTAAQASIANSDACLLVVDSTTGWTDEHEQLTRDVPNGAPVITLWNKCDHAGTTPPPATLPSPAVPTSAITGEGIQDVLQHLAVKLVPETPDADQPLPVLPELNVRLTEFLQHRDLDVLTAGISTLFG